MGGLANGRGWSYMGWRMGWYGTNEYLNPKPYIYMAHACHPGSEEGTDAAAVMSRCCIA